VTRESKSPVVGHDTNNAQFTPCPVHARPSRLVQATDCPHPNLTDPRNNEVSGPDRFSQPFGQNAKVPARNQPASRNGRFAAWGQFEISPHSSFALKLEDSGQGRTSQLEGQMSLCGKKNGHMRRTHRQPFEFRPLPKKAYKPHVLTFPRQFPTVPARPNRGSPVFPKVYRSI
jgi:hypothetical protein